MDSIIGPPSYARAVAPPLALEKLILPLGPSRLMAAIVVGIHVLAAAAVWVAPVPVIWAVGWSAILALQVVWIGRRHVLRNDAGATVELELLQDGSVYICTRGGARRACRIGEPSFVSPLLVVLALRSEGGRKRYIPVPADSVDVDSFRRLCVWLRWRWQHPSQV